MSLLGIGFFGDAAEDWERFRWRAMTVLPLGWGQDGGRRDGVRTVLNDYDQSIRWEQCFGGGITAVAEGKDRSGQGTIK